MLAAVLSALLSVYGLIELVEGLGIPVLSLEEWLFPNPPMIGAIPSDRMSPATASLLFLSGVVVPMLFLRERGGERKKLFGDLAGGLGILVAVAGTVFVLSYLQGDPFLYGTSTIPMAATTAVAFLLLGTGQILAVGPDNFPLRLIAGPSARARLLRVFVSTTVGVVVAINLLHVYADWIFFNDDAFLSGVSTTAFALISGVLIARVALKVGDDMDRSETVRRGAEEKLRESEERYRTLFEKMDEGFCVVEMIDDPGGKAVDYRFVEINQAFEKHTGLQQALGKTIRQMVPDHEAHWFEIYGNVARTGESIRFENQAAAMRKYYAVFAFRVGGDGSRRVGILFQDITGFKQSERALKESEEIFRVIFEDSKDGIILVDAERRNIHRANKTFCEMVQYSVDEAGRLGVSDIHPRESLPLLIDAFERTMKQGSALSDNFPVKRKDGSIFWADIKASMVTISGKEYVLGNFRDVTERKKASEALARLGMAVDQAFEAIISTDRDGTILYVNPAFERISGYSREEAIGKNPRFLHSGEHDESFYREMWGTLARGEIWSGHFINRKKNGQLYEEDATISPVRDSSGKIVSFVGVMRDLTKTLGLEKQVRTAQKMEAVGTLAGGIAHDFNNALTGIVGFGELLRMRMAGDGQALHDLDEILRCAERASTLTRQLLTFARRQVIDPVNLNLSALVADLMKFIGKVVGAQIEVKTSLGKDVPTIHADRGQIEQVVMNLCLNARDAMPEGGRLVVETGDVYLDEEYVRQNPYMKTGRYALLTVSDTGVGMDEKTRERVFEPFFTTKGPDKGTGLGLSMVYGIVKQHGGFIHLYSEPGKGTAFKVYFPATEAPPDAVPAIREEEHVRGGTETILLAEDEEAIRSFIERGLKELGYDVLVARDGEEAVGIFRQRKEIVLAVLDVVMPRKGGKVAFEEMQRENPRLKVIFMSGYSADAIHESFVLIPGTPFLQKPFGPTILARKIREVLDTQ